MISKDLYKRFHKAFQDPEKVNAEEYQKIIEENASKASESTERSTLRLLSLVMLLILVVLGEIDKMSVGFAEISNKSIILITLLVLIGYTHYDLVFTLAKFDQLSVIYKIIIKHRHRIVHEQGLSKYFLFPPTLYDYVYPSSDGIANQIQSILGLAEFLSIFIVIPFGAEIIAFGKLSNLLNSEFSILLKASLFIMLFITIVLNLQSALRMIVLFWGKEPGDQSH